MKLKDIQDIIATEPNTLFRTSHGLVRIADIVDQRFGHSLGMVKTPWVIKVSDVRYIRAKGDTPSHCVGYNTRTVSSRALQPFLSSKGTSFNVKNWIEHMDNVSAKVAHLLQKENS